MNIFLISDAFPPDVGGLARAVNRHGAQLVAHGHDISVLVVDGQIPAGEIKFSDENGLKIFRLGRSSRMCDTLTDWTEWACRLGKQNGCQIFHGYFVAYAGFVATYAARMCGRRSVVSARGNDLDRLVFDAERAPFIFQTLQHADAITTVSTELRQKVWALSGRNDAVWIPNSLDAGLFSPVPENESAALRESLGLSDRPVIGFAGEARLKKGLAILLRAFAQVAPETGAQLLLVGGVRPKDRPVLQLFQEHHPDLPVYTIPYQPQHTLPAYYQLMDLVVFPSLRDGLPNALLEAMACERATISSAVGGIPDVVTDGENGWLVPPRDEPALVERIHIALGDPEARREIGRTARRTVLTHFTPERELNANLSIYRRLLNLKSA